MGAQGSTTKTSQIHRSTLPKTYRSIESTKEVCELHRIHQRERELDGIHQEKGECELPAVVDTHRRRCFLWFSRSPPLLAPRAAHLVHAGSAVASPACRRRSPHAPPAPRAARTGSPSPRGAACSASGYSSDSRSLSPPQMPCRRENMYFYFVSLFKGKMPASYA